MKKSFSLSDLNTVKKCDESVVFEPVGADGKKLGFSLSVLGAHSTTVQKWVNKELNKRRRQEAVQKKRGAADTRPVEDDIEFGYEVVAIRITGWEGITDEFTPENALLLCQTNPDICLQVREVSEDIANFTRG
ncbi:MAG: hypothetical protein PF495_02695 [Spirochaetales bacterium]|jgi:hypothetical protein|nr:hypothetical protein [Spirochaetales bacterium]